MLRSSLNFVKLKDKLRILYSRQQNNSHCKMANQPEVIKSGLSKIELTSDNPVDLFTSWHQEAKKPVTVACLATCSADNKPHVRNVILQHFSKNGFVFVTDSRGRKNQQMTETGMRASMCIYWSHKNDNEETIWRQTRLEGTVEMLPKDELQKLWDANPVYAKIRAHLCHQDSKVDWDELKKRHDELLEEARKNPQSLSMPDHNIGYRLVPSWMDFYHAKSSEIADRFEFIKGADGQWTHRRLAA